MITFIRREARNLMRAAPNDTILERIKDIEFDDANQFIEILCESIKLKDVELSIVALQSIRNIINNNHEEQPHDADDNPESESNEENSLKTFTISPKSLQLITDTITRIEFTSTDPDLVVEGYFQAVRVCGTLIKCNLSCKLTNGSISEIIIFCFRVFNSKLVKWLRDKADRTLLSITTILFQRLKEFPEDLQLKPSYQIRLRLAGASSQSTFKELADQSLATENSPSNNSSSTNSASSSALRIITERNQAYNLAIINDYFCYLASLINPSTQEQNFDSSKLNEANEKIKLGIKLLKTAFNEAAKDIGQKSCLTYTTRNNICYNIVSILKSSCPIFIVNNALNLAVDIFVELRYHLKYQFESFLERLMEMLATNSSANANSSDQSSINSYENLHSSSLIVSNLELRSDVLNAVLELFRNIQHFPHELYYNFDCDPFSSNIYENLIQICSKNCFQQIQNETHFTQIQLTSFKCLLTNLADIHSVETYCSSNSRETYQLGFKNEGLVNSNKGWSKFPKTYKDLNEAKKRKRLLWLALDKFNARPKDGIQFIKDNKLIDNNGDLVQFLKDNFKVDKKVLGEFLSKEENRPLRESFINSIDFNNLRIDEALRLMLEKFRLPGESQLIERILDTFSIHWFEQNKGILQNSDQALSLAYAIIMLNVDQHSRKVKPMTCDEFDRNLLGPKSDRIYDRKLLDQIYTNIRDNEIVLPDEQVGSVRQRYLWKCTMVKSERVESIYWTTSELRNANNNQINATTITTADTNNTTTIARHELLGNDQDASQQSPPSHCPIVPNATPIVQACIENKLPDATVLIISEPCDTYNDQYPAPITTIANGGGDADHHQNHHDHGTHESTFKQDNCSFEFSSNDAFVELELKEVNKILFEIMWSPTVAALSFIFDKIDTNLYEDLSMQIVDKGFIKFAHLCARHGHLDNLVVSLCKFTNDLNHIPHNHSGSQRQITISCKNLLAAKSLLAIIRDYADYMRDSWSKVVSNILQWYCSGCISDVILFDEEFALRRESRLKMRDIKKSSNAANQQSLTFLKTFITYIAGQSTGNEGNSAVAGSGTSTDNGKLQNGSASNNNNSSNHNNNNKANSEPSAIEELIKTIRDAKYSEESLVELITALTTSSIDGDPEEVEDAEVFKLEIFTQVILNNKDKVGKIWPRIEPYFARQSAICGRSSWWGERIISASFKVAIQFKPKQEVFSLLKNIIKTLDPEIIRGDHTFVALRTLTELHPNVVPMDARELEACFKQVIFPFLDKVLDNCDPHLVEHNKALERAISLLSKIFKKHFKLLKDLQTFALLWYEILDTMEKYIKVANSDLKKATFEAAKIMIIVMDTEECMSVEMKDRTNTKFLFWGFSKWY